MTRPLRKVLVANRGEIACRVIAACRELGLHSVAVHSEADRDALHVRLADEAVAIGPAPPAESYLDIERLLGAARASGADALHPGYGFRSESPALAEACAEAGLVFIGPGAEAIRRMGDKRAARALAREAGVAVVPGFEGEPHEALAAAAGVGFPLLVKAAMGGGGKGMQRVDRGEDLGAALEAAARVAGSAFGDRSVYLERLLEGARHVEVQVLGDGRGNALHVYERECSLQRRHQKVIEESPAPGLTPELRAALGEAAVALARRAQYLSAGTCEFLLAPDGRFFFLEMNTRIQVEHPVTEMVTGVDLVKAQLAIAAGGALPDPATIQPRGHAVEARVTAEDPLDGFLPQAGRLLRFELRSAPFVRVDTGFEAGQTVPSDYDSLLAKVIAWGRDRDEAFDRLAAALDAAVIHGVRTNLPLLRHLVRHEAVRAGRLSTTLLETEILPPFLVQATAPAPSLALAAAALAEILLPAGSDAGGAAAPGTTGAFADPFDRLGPLRLGGAA